MHYSETTHDEVCKLVTVVGIFDAYHGRPDEQARLMNEMRVTAARLRQSIGPTALRESAVRLDHWGLR